MADDNFIMEYVIEREKNKVLNRQPLLSIYYERGLFPPPPTQFSGTFSKFTVWWMLEVMGPLRRIAAIQQEWWGTAETDGSVMGRVQLFPAYT